jgi:hypothetical protein
MLREDPITSIKKTCHCEELIRTLNGVLSKKILAPFCRFNVFPIAFVVFAGLTLMWYLAFGWKKRKVRRKMTMADLST